MKEHMRLSIIIPVYNVEKYIHKCLDSLLFQIDDTIEIILVDDGSSDLCPHICDEYARIYKNLKVIHSSNQGVAIARKTGVDNAVSEYVTFIDSDDWVETDYIKSILEAIDKFKSDVICFGFYSVINKKKIEHNFPLKNKHYNRSDIQDEIFSYLIENNKAHYFPNQLWNKVFRRELYEVNQVTQRIVMGEDAACVKPCIAKANSLYVIRKCLYNYRINQNSITCSKKTLPWDGPYLIYLHYMEHFALEGHSFIEQINRNFVHNLFNVAISQFSSRKNYNEIKADILKNICLEVYSPIINSCCFSILSKGYLAYVTLKYRLIFMQYLYWKFSVRNKHI